jgi:chemotaxis protein methyltransferase CheR
VDVPLNGRPRGQPMAEPDLEDIEMELLLEGMVRQYGFDFRGYGRGMLKRRLWRRVVAEKTVTLSGLQDRVLHDPACFERLLLDLSITVTSMFRDPGFYRAFRERVVPLLRTYPSIRVWDVGCSTGEELFSLAIVLREEGLYDRARIYATDINEDALQIARKGEFALANIGTYTTNYLRGGGSAVFSTYYTADGQRARFDESLVDNVVFARHNLVADRVFNEFNVIVCRNVLIYFSPQLREDVQHLLHESLGPLGVLALGPKESLRSAGYKALDAAHSVYRRID